MSTVKPLIGSTLWRAVVQIDYADERIRFIPMTVVAHTPKGIKVIDNEFVRILKKQRFVKWPPGSRAYCRETQGEALHDLAIRMNRYVEHCRRRLDMAMRYRGVARTAAEHAGIKLLPLMEWE